MAVSTIKRQNYVYGTLITSSLASNNITDNNSTIYRSGNIVTLRVDLKSSQSGVAQSTGVWIPDGFRPPVSLHFIGGDGGTSGHSVGSINPNGTATFYFGSTKYAQGTVTYVAP